MEMICLDVEGVLFPEIWIEVSKKTGIKVLERTTREEPDYEKLLKWRIGILKENNIKLKDIQEVISHIKPLEGAKEFLDKVRSVSQVVLLSDTFEEFANPLMKQLGWPTILCNNLNVDKDGFITSINMRLNDGKRKAIEAFRSLGYRTFASGDSYNDINMIKTADCGCLFRPPKNIIAEQPDVKCVTDYDEFHKCIENFLNRS